MTRQYFFRFILSLVLIFASLVLWKETGSIFSIALLLLGLVELLGALLYILTGKTALGGYRKIFVALLIGTIIGFLIFDLPSIYLFKIWTYQKDIPTPFGNFFRYLAEVPGWGVFLLVFYESYKLIHLALDRSFHAIGLSRHSNISERVFSFLGVSGLFLFLISIALAIAGFRQSWWPPTLAAIGVWLVLENIEFRKNKETLLVSISRGHLMPLLSILVGSLVLGFVFEFFNIISPKQNWVYSSLPLQYFQIFGVPIFLLLSWAWMYIIFLSAYRIICDEKNIWE